MASIKDISDERVRKLAETLKQSGLASSETEAVRMAQNMTHTNNRVSQNFEEKKDKTIMGLSHLHKEYPKKEDAPKQEPVFESPFHNQKIKETQKPHTIKKEETQEVYAMEIDEEAEETIHQEILEPTQKEQKKTAPAPAPVKQEVPQKKEPDKTPERPAPKRGFAQMEESKVDLSKVFGFKK